MVCFPLSPIAFTLLLLWVSTVDGQTYENRLGHIEDESRLTTFILQGLLEAMGMELPDKKKKDDDTPPEPGPTPPEPDPEPAPPKEEDDGFFDDDFFDDDKSFEELQKEMEEEFVTTTEGWDREYKETVERWEKERKVFLGRLEKHKENLVPVSQLSSSPQQVEISAPRPDSVRNMRAGEYYLIPRALDIPIRNQLFRGTCAAFAAVRGIETLLAQNEYIGNYSEHYFFWLSKPDCHPCDRDGSSLLGGYQYSSSSRDFNIPLEQECDYLPQNRDSNNVTHSPLSSACQNASGAVRVKRFHGVDSAREILAQLQRNQPVVGGFKLSPNFYENRGVVTLEGVVEPGKTNSHAGEHALLLVGYIRLPQRMASEGDYCLITANSWGEGYGRGGYTCLTEKWVQKFGFQYGNITP